MVIASNAGGVFSPFGDVTTLMVWQKEKLKFLDFAGLVIPGIVNWLVPALIMVLSPTQLITHNAILCNKYLIEHKFSKNNNILSTLQQALPSRQGCSLGPILEGYSNLIRFQSVSQSSIHVTASEFQARSIGIGA